jgi:hypothetical protein
VNASLLPPEAQPIHEDPYVEGTSGSLFTAAQIRCSSAVRPEEHRGHVMSCTVLRRDVLVCAVVFCDAMGCTAMPCLTMPRCLWHRRVLPDQALTQGPMNP